ncbi:CDK-activating kinase assembly factor MAT1 [Liparis tanakae]|uniref:CDK-activating kinase assembly factor MAT1 n=1 Tax=Liparis tanakae TaxID=230148 RepID=A0A4Z2J1L8_9TELE|nr:CDK-activating kinase assembly factor MAT1 [Liparis tanakae]
MEQYQKENRDLIQKNKVKLEQSQLPATILLAQHKVRAAKLETQIEQQKQAVKPTSLFSTGIHMHQTVSLQPPPRIEEVLYLYKPLQVVTYGPPVPELEQLGRLGLINMQMKRNSQFLPHAGAQRREEEEEEEEEEGGGDWCQQFRGPGGRMLDRKDSATEINEVRFGQERQSHRCSDTVGLIQTNHNSQDAMCR